MKILLIDDSKIQIMTQRKILEDNGINESDIHEAINGKNALEMIADSNCSYKLIFVDMNMPEMNGLDFVKKFRIGYETVPVVMISSENEQKKIDKASEAGVTEYLVKPYMPDDLWAVACRYL